MCFRKMKLKWKLKSGQILKFSFSSYCDKKVFVPVGQSTIQHVVVLYFCVLLCVLHVYNFWQSRSLHLRENFSIIALSLLTLDTLCCSVYLFAMCPARMYVISDSLDPQRASQISPMWYPANLCSAYCYNDIQGGIALSMHYIFYETNTDVRSC